MTYQTNNPVGSVDVRDLYDNAENLDNFSNGPLDAYPDRFGVPRQSLQGIRNASQYVNLGPYAAGLNFTALNQVFSYNHGTGAEFYSPGPAITLPYTTTGAGAGEIANFRSVGDAVLRSDLADTDGAGLVGYDPATVYPPNTVGAAIGASVESVFALLSAPKVSGAVRLLASYHTGWAASATTPPKGGGIVSYDASMPKSQHDGMRVFSPTVPWDGTQAALAAFLAGTGETTPAGSGCWVRSDFQGTVLESGARADNTTDDRAAFQNAMDRVKSVRVPQGSYALGDTLISKGHGYQLHGDSMYDTILNFSNAGPAWRNDQAATTTRLFCELTDLRINNPSVGGNILVDWKSHQHGKIHRVFLAGQQVADCVLLQLSAVWVTTECTYNVVSQCYFGNMAYGISIGDGANDCTIRDCRFQPGLAPGGIGILANASAPGRISVLNILDNGFEYPGAVTTGVNILQNCDNVRIVGNRFEQLLTGIVIGATGNRRISGTNRTDNYFDSTTTNINISTGGRSAAPGVVAAGTYTGAGSLTEIGASYGLTGTRTGAGSYSFTYLDTSYPDSGQVVSVQSSQPINVVSKTPTGFTLTCQNISVANTDAAQISIRVDYNR